MTTTTTLQLDDIQRIVLYGLTHLPVSVYSLCRIEAPDRFNDWLRSELDRRTIASAAPEDHEARADYQTFLAFTDRGLVQLGVSPEERSTFLPEFQQGMTAAHRARVIGDAPGGRGWRWGRPSDSDVHVLCAAYAARRDALPSGPPPGCSLVRETAAEHSDAEPFGFRDGLSQPYVVGSGRSDNDVPVQDRVAAGEFVLGYENAFGVLPASPWTEADSPLAREHLSRAPLSRAYDLGLNGSYLVARELLQDVHAFHALTPEDRARVIGRWPSGEPLVTHPVDAPASAGRPGADPTGNEFRYRPTDAAGLRCPLGAHIRRANPRDALADEERGVSAELAVRRANQHRILRRSRAFRRPEETGLFFMCFNANIERQFEFIQQSWLNNPKFAGPLDETDPLLSQQGTSFTLRTGPDRETLPALRQFVRVLGGAYFFMPGLRVLRYLVTRERVSSRQGE
jgi:Dyp-type peroxidase family